MYVVDVLARLGSLPKLAAKATTDRRVERVAGQVRVDQIRLGLAPRHQGRTPGRQVGKQLALGTALRAAGCFARSSRPTRPLNSVAGSFSSQVGHQRSAVRWNSAIALSCLLGAGAGCPHANLRHAVRGDDPGDWASRRQPVHSGLDPGLLEHAPDHTATLFWSGRTQMAGRKTESAVSVRAASGMGRTVPPGALRPARRSACIAGQKPSTPISAMA
jgi:hypothetical protein